MKKIFTRFISIPILIGLIISGGLTVSAKLVYGSDSVSVARQAIEGIIGYNLEKDGSDDIAEWINDALPNGIGQAAEWYVIALSQYRDNIGRAGSDNRSADGDSLFYKYKDSLEKYLKEHTEKSATARLKFSLAFAASGVEEGDFGDEYIQKCMSDGTVNGLGIMSLVFGLHLANNGYIYTDPQDGNTGVDISDSTNSGPGRDINVLWTNSTARLIEKILDEQHKDGGWSVIGEYGDIDVTAMVLQALAPSVDPENKKLSKAVGKALTFLSEKQLESGAYKSFGTENAESTAQVLACLSALGIDCVQDERFIKASGNVLDGLLSFQTAEGCFSHDNNGAYSATATVQSFYSLVSYVRMKEGKTPLYVLDSCAGKRLRVMEKIETGREEGTETGEKTGRNGRDENSTGTGNDGTGSGETGNDKTGSGRNDDNGTDETGIGETGNDKTGSGRNDEKDGNESENGLSEGTGTDAPGPDKAGTDQNNRSDKDNPAHKNGSNYKPIACIVIAVLVLITFAVLKIKKKHPKNYLFTVIVAAAAVLIVIFTDFKSAGSYYSDDGSVKTDTAGKVTMSIRCDILNGVADSDHIPADGCILDTTEFDLSEGETVYDILIEAAKKYSISVDHKGGSEIVYISGINYLYELDYGDLSGWVYKVNGELPSVGCAGYKLTDGDKIEWCYTLDLGNDSLKPEGDRK